MCNFNTQTSVLQNLIFSPKYLM